MSVRDLVLFLFLFLFFSFFFPHTTERFDPLIPIILLVTNCITVILVAISNFDVYALYIF